MMGHEEKRHLLTSFLNQKKEERKKYDGYLSFFFCFWDSADGSLNHFLAPQTEQDFASNWFITCVALLA